MYHANVKWNSMTQSHSVVCFAGGTLYVVLLCSMYPTRAAHILFIIISVLWCVGFRSSSQSRYSTERQFSEKSTLLMLVSG